MMAPVSAAALHDRVAALAGVVNADAGLVRRGRFLSTTFLLEIGEVEYLVKVAEGRVAHRILHRTGAAGHEPEPAADS